MTAGHMSPRVHQNSKKFSKSHGLWIYAKSAYFQVPENGTSSVRIQKRRPLFHANTPPKWRTRHLFHVFATFGSEISKF